MLTANEVYPTRNYSEIKVLKYNDYNNVDVVFLGTGFKTSASADCIRKGNVKDRIHKSVHGVGFIGDGKYKSSLNGSNTEHYKSWSRMMARCYSEATQDRQPTYKGCSVDPIWHNFQNFAEWFGFTYHRG